MIDLRSDTLTQPTEGMKRAMYMAELGDDVYGEDLPTKSLEAYVSALFALPYAVFCPSGTMANQIALGVNTRPRDEVICAAKSHIYCYEGGAWASLSAVSLRLIASETGKITAKDVQDNINADDVHFPRTAMVALENTVNRGGGCYYTASEVADIQKICQQNNLKLHVDGARIFNALLASGESPSAHGQLLDSLSVCLSKGLGAPVGSLLLLKDAAAHKEARRMRKILGGGMRQIGMLAAAGLYALQNQIERLREDHQSAKDIANLLQKLPFVQSVMPCYTNIVLFDIAPAYGSGKQFVDYLGSQGVKASFIGGQQVRFVTHLNLKPADFSVLEAVLERFAV